jgi:hypothetical protein
LPDAEIKVLTAKSPRGSPSRNGREIEGWGVYLHLPSFVKKKKFIT